MNFVLTLTEQQIVTTLRTLEECKLREVIDTYLTIQNQIHTQKEPVKAQPIPEQDAVQAQE